MKLDGDKLSRPSYFTLVIVYTEEEENAPNETQLVHPYADGNIQRVQPSYLEYIKHEIMNEKIVSNGVANLDREAIKSGRFSFSHSNFTAELPLLSMEKIPKAWE